jgi:hypothetical protein
MTPYVTARRPSDYEEDYKYLLRVAKEKQQGMGDFGVAVVAFISFILGALAWAILP